MPVFVSLECRTFYETLLLIFLVTQVLLMRILWKSCQNLSLWNTMNMLFVFGMDVSHAQYSMNNYSKHEIILLDTCLLYIYLPPDWVGK